MTKTAVVLLNLGGPDSLASVKPFLRNLFNDPAIINLPQPFRSMLSFVIATLRNAKAQAIYKYMGGKSPILEHTMQQAEALEKKLLSQKKGEFKVFVCMRHWHPMSDVVVKKVKSYTPDRVILLPLYPQFSTTTTGSSFTDWDASCEKNQLSVQTSRICCYPSDKGFVAAQVKLIKDMYWKASENGKPRILFSAHGLPEKIVAKGDPYQYQVEQSVKAITQVLAIDELDHVTCYQSRVGMLEWIGPSTEEEILQAGRDNVPVLVVPVSFVSEHSETLVELDMDYRKLAQLHNVPGYYRVPALNCEEFFIESLSDICLNPPKNAETCPPDGRRLCPNNFIQCLCTI